ncbi:MAG: pyridoxamine 5'-phosphate oxidase family protein [Marinosulfonomonas sp.]|nr:pyridoxamine 5'-phosphate oxidase family protein [Marinosulfonomonas sp.]
MADWRSTLDGVLNKAWCELEDFQSPRSGPPGLATLATTGPDGAPELRSVVLRSASRASAVVETLTDAATPKVAQLRLAPQIGLLVWCPELLLQIRLRGEATVITGKDLPDEWAALPKEARQNYGVTPDPGTPIAASDAYQRVPERNRLACLRVTLRQIDVVHLDPKHDIRALYTRADAWRGQWLAP